MLRFIRNLEIKYKLAIGFIGATFFGVLIIVVVGLYIAITGLTDLYNQSLDAERDLVAQQTEYYFGNLESQLRHTAKSPALIDAFKYFSVGIDSLNKRFAFTDPTTNQNLNSDLKLYYQNEFLPRLLENTQSTDRAENYLPTNDVEIYLQSLYIAQNKFPTGNKDALSDNPNDNSPYGKAHSKYHPYLSNLQQSMGLYDVFLIDNKGQIIYTVFKEIDFATNVFDGAFSRTGLGMVYANLQKSPDSKSVFYADFKDYIPSYSKPAMFVGVPIFDNDVQLGVLAIQISIERINSIIYPNIDRIKLTGFDKKIISYLIGPDGTHRSDHPYLLFDEEDNFKDLILKATENKTITAENAIKARNFRSTIMLLKTNPKIITEINSKNIGNQECRNAFNEKTFTAFRPLKIRNLSWGVVSEAKRSDVYLLINLFIYGCSAAFIIGIIIIVFSALYSAKYLADPLIQLAGALEMLSKGEMSGDFSFTSADELGNAYKSARKLNERFGQITSFANQVGQGKYDGEFKSAGKTDILGEALIKMAKNLQQNQELEQQRTWHNEGLTNFAILTRTHVASVRQLTTEAVTYITKYAKLTMGIVYLADTNNKSELIALASYAYDRSRFVKNTIKIGDGLIGQVFIEGKPFYLADMPGDFVKIKSGMGESGPGSVFMVPLKHNEKILGVFEVASFNQIDDYVRNFVTQCCDILSAAIDTIAVAEKTKELLEQSQIMTEQLRAQEEEMRQNFEELQATQEEMNRKASELEENLRAANYRIKELEAELNKSNNQR